MHSPSLSSPPAESATPSALELVLRQARKLHRAAKTGSLMSAMPALRRVHAAGVFPGDKLSTLYARRAQLQRKHFLRALAVEAGFLDWEHFRPELLHWAPEALAHYRVDACFATLNAWFANVDEAEAHARLHGGQLLRVGRQAVVLAASLPNPGSDALA
jgi:hypothetical protein